MHTDKDDDQFGLLAGAGGYGFNNFDPSTVQEEDVILGVIAMDESPSIISFEPQLNEAFKGFGEEMQKSHVANKFMLKLVVFADTATSKTGFQPVGLMDMSSFVFRGRDNATALVDAAYLSLESAMDYRKQLEATGVNVKVLIFVVTDGQENSSKRNASDVKKYIDDLMKEERNVLSIETILFGIGDPASFTKSQQDMGFKHLAVVGNSAKEIRKMIGFISASVSRSSAGQQVTF